MNAADIDKTEYPFPLLVDAPEESTIDAAGWLAAPLAETREQAAVVYAQVYSDAFGGCPWTDDGLVLRGTGIVRLVATLTVSDGEEQHELRGAEAARVALEQHHEDELRFERCSDDDPAGADWWHVTLEEATA